jgi:hypothetical protein
MVRRPCQDTDMVRDSARRHREHSQETLPGATVRGHGQGGS